MCALTGTVGSFFGPAVIKNFHKGQLQATKLTTPQASFAKKVPSVSWRCTIGAQVPVWQVFRTRPGVPAASAFRQEGNECCERPMAGSMGRRMSLTGICLHPLPFAPFSLSTQGQPASAGQCNMFCIMRGIHLPSKVGIWERLFLMVVLCGTS